MVLHEDLQIAALAYRPVDGVGVELLLQGDDVLQVEGCHGCAPGNSVDRWILMHNYTAWGWENQPSALPR